MAGDVNRLLKIGGVYFRWKKKPRSFDIRLGTLFSVPVLLHYAGAAWLFCCLFIGWWAPLVIGLSVLIHEFGHVVAGQQMGCKTKHVRLNAFGAESWMQLPKDPRQQIILASAGPIASLYLLVYFFGLWMMYPSKVAAVGIITNLIGSIGNLIPIYPHDGGRMLRAWFLLKHCPAEANRKTRMISRACVSIVGGIFLLYSNVIGILVCAIGYWYLGQKEVWEEQLY